jgi:hypothetical protein
VSDIHSHLRTIEQKSFRYGQSLVILMAATESDGTIYVPNAQAASHYRRLARTIGVPVPHILVQAMEAKA